MAYLLIRDRSRSNPDPAKDALCPKQGMVVEVFEDNDPRGFRIPPGPPFVWLHITNVTKAQAEKYIEMNVDGNGIVIGRRLYLLDWATLPAKILTAFETTGYYADTYQRLRGYIKNQKTGVYE